MNAPAQPAPRRLAVRLHAGAEQAVRRGHPWVFDDGIRQLRHEGAAGDLAVIFDRHNRFIAIGLYDPSSPIRIRVLHHGEPAPIDRAWFAARIADAWRVRQPLVAEGTTGFRVVHGENDGLPGLIVDRYGDSLVVKLYTAAWLTYLDDVLDALDAVFPAVRTVLRLGRTVQRAAAGGPVDGDVVRGAPLDGPVLFVENGITFEADLVRGQKTGFFLDQRDNRARVERHCRGRTVLNVFAYTGGFSVYAARGGARTVTSLDVSAPALAAAERNFAHNRTHPAVAAAEHRTIAGDAFDVMQQMRARGERFDVVILDPPSFAKARAEVERALASYARIVRLGLDVLADGGLLVAASCSSRISAEAFRDVVERTAAGAGRPLRVLEETGHALDHPIGFPEGAYLKCIFARAR
ncbi:MAG TPA: class I SAM-dependent rRNA methyltransferase [Longimicrobiales bacterium]|nr:class I SAM-dependent rRNA methyltransferase [Longimicrobiales bacterium]